MVTLKDIANKTGFSLSVVSRAMNPSPDQKVAEKTREIILATAAELGYRPNHAASLLAKGMSTAIGCFMPAMVGEMVGQIVSGLSYAANQAGFAYQLYFGNSLEDYRHFIDHCQHTSAAGMISYLPANVDPCNKNDEFYKNTKTVFSIHNLAYQGQYFKEILDFSGLNKDEVFHEHGLEHFGALIWMKGAINYADKIIAVSPIRCTYNQIPIIIYPIKN